MTRLMALLTLILFAGLTGYPQFEPWLQTIRGAEAQLDRLTQNLHLEVESAWWRCPGVLNTSL